MDESRDLLSRAKEAVDRAWRSEVDDLAEELFRNAADNPTETFLNGLKFANEAREAALRALEKTEDLKD